MRDKPELRILIFDFDGKRMKRKTIDKYISSRFSPFERNWNVIYTDRYPHVVILSFYDRISKGILMKLLKLRFLYGPALVIVGYTGESFKPDYTHFDYWISLREDSVKNFYEGLTFKILTYWKGKAFNSLSPIESSFNRRDLHIPTEFCNFVYSNPAPEERKTFCKMLMRYKQVDCAGKVLHNTDKLWKLEEQRTNKTNKIIPVREFPVREFMKNYKFSISFENKSQKGYITEKIFNAHYAGTIPIYWGCPQVGEVLNSDSFINCHEYTSFEAVIKRVKEIDDDSNLYLKYKNTPFFKNGVKSLDEAKRRCSIMCSHIERKILKNQKKILYKFPLANVFCTLWLFLSYTIVMSAHVTPRVLKKFIFLIRNLFF